MNPKYIKKLEYDVILQELSSYCITGFGKNLCLSLEPSFDKQKVFKLLEETSEAICLLSENEPSIPTISNVEDSLNLLNRNGILSIASLLELAHILKTSSLLKDYFYSKYDTTNFPIIDAYFSKLYTNTSIVKTIENAILDNTTLSDLASTNLSSIRKKKRKLEETIKEKLNHFTHSSTYSKYIQEPVITIRNSRYVIPVKEEYRNMIKGFVHDISSSGSTVFIEPMAIFDLNNDLHILQSEEKMEIEKILTHLSSLFAPYTNELKEDYETIGTIDFIFAKAKYALSIDGILPTINQEKQLCFLRARHPLIEKEAVIPIDIELGKTFSSLLISGPNTGGKTVTLKTVGLLCLMAYSGLFIPAKEGSSLYVFDEIFADIGDEQSISESLSTFSSHICNIIEILNSSTSKSLVLLDELGSGTDPVEGSSLAISILETFYQKRNSYYFYFSLCRIKTLCSCS